jgi:D-amino peptidase
MMKIYISLDMEGIPGTFNWEQEKDNRSAVKAYMTDHLQSVIEAIKSSTQNTLIDEITIADSHNAGDNIDYGFTTLDERISLISGNPRPYYMMPAFSSQYDQVFLIGYHAGTGALQANMDHSYSNRRIHKIWLNDRRMNEALINSAYAGHFGVPVTVVTGDKSLSAELLNAEAMPWVNYVTTKEALSKFAAKNYSSLAVRTKTTEAVRDALSKDKSSYPLYNFHTPINLRIEFISTSMADVACYMPDTKRLDGRTIEFRNDDYAVMFEAIMALITLASSANLA